MYFDALPDESTNSIWDKIIATIGPNFPENICPNTSQSGPGRLPECLGGGARSTFR